MHSSLHTVLLKVTLVLSENASLPEPGSDRQNEPIVSVTSRGRYLIIPHHETFSTTTQPPYSSTKG